MTYIRPSVRGHCTGCAKTVALTATSAARPYCLDCRRAGKAPRTTRAPHGTPTRYRHGCRCGECRASQTARMREYASRRRAEGRPIDFAKTRTKIDRDCDHCGESFLARADAVGAGQGRFCSTGCRNEANRVRPKQKPARWRRAERKLARAIEGSIGGGVWVQGPCRTCAEPFMSRGAGSRYCSPSCRQAARRDRKRWISAEDRLAIYVRDAWVCRICEEPTSRDYDNSDPWSPTLDHIVPRSLGGTDDAENLRLAHLWCNSVRGDTSFYEDADLREVA